MMSISIVFLAIVIIFEFIYLFLLKSETNTNQTAVEPTTHQEEELNSLFNSTDPTLPAEQLTYYPEATNTPIPEVREKVTELTKRTYDLVRTTTDITTSTRLLQKYEGRIAEIEPLDQDIPIPVYNEMVRIKLKLSIQAENEPPKTFYYSENTLANMEIIDSNNNILTINDLKAGDIIQMDATYNIDLYNSPPEYIKIVKIN